MRLTEIRYDKALPVDSYGPGFFRLGGQVFRGAMLITPWDAGLWGGYPDTAAPLTLAGRIDVLLLGTGPEIAHPPIEFVQAMESAGIGEEPMNSPAACRTYNVLLGEGRRIALAVLPV
jgi:uncharacterized protein